MDGKGREGVSFVGFSFVETDSWVFDRRIVGALVIVRDVCDLVSMARAFGCLSLVDTVASRFISMRVLLRRNGGGGGSSDDGSTSVRSSTVIRSPFSNLSYMY